MTVPPRGDTLGQRSVAPPQRFHFLYIAVSGFLENKNRSLQLFRGRRDMLTRVEGKIFEGSKILSCTCSNGSVDRVDGSSRQDNLVVYCTCGKRYVCTRTGALTESQGAAPCPKEKIPGAEVTP
jgi:hypothetical protein